MDAAPSTAGCSERATVRVLVVEDDADVATAMVELLRREGYQAEVASDGLQAVNLARSFAPDAVLLDLGLPGMDGYRVAEQLYAQNVKRRPLLIATTGRGAALDRACSTTAGIDLHLVKPIDPNQLLGLLRRFAETIRP